MNKILVTGLLAIAACFNAFASDLTQAPQQEQKYFEVTAGSLKSNLRELAGRLGYGQVIFEGNLECSDWSIPSTFWISGEGTKELMTTLIGGYPIRARVHGPDKVIAFTAETDLPTCTAEQLK